MISSRVLSALAASVMLSVAVAQSSSIKLIPTPTVTLPANAMQEIGCFETGVPLEDHGPYKFQSQGNCQFICIQEQKPVMGLSDGTNCWCGDYIPPKSAQVNNASCDTTCGGTGKPGCGGPKLWWVILSGTSRNRIENYDPKKHASSSSASQTSTAAQQTKEPEETVVVTAPSDSQNDKSKGPNKAGIAAGVVVGVVVLAAIIAGAVFFLRHKKRRELEEEHRRQTAATSFIAGGKLHTSNSSMTDSRLDPEYFANRRSSNGSIADNEDYSRRILKVTNA